MDSRGRLFVGDRGNNRIQIFDQDGKLLAIWTQFSRPSGIYVDQHDILYVTDSESRNADGYGHHPGWKRGIRIGSAKDGMVTAFIPDPDPDQETTRHHRRRRHHGRCARQRLRRGSRHRSAVVKYEKK